MGVKKMVMCALGMALVFLMTVFIVIPIPAMGYVNFGDSAVLLFASLLNPLASAIVGGIGSAMGDIYLGYSQYAIFTLIIKGLEGLIVSYLFRTLPKRIRLLSFFIGIVIMIGGYYITDVILIGNFVAVLPAVQGNLVQGGACLVLAILAQYSFAQLAARHPKLFEFK